MKSPLSAPGASRRVRSAVPAPAVTPILCGPLYPALRQPRFVLPTLALLAGASLLASGSSARAATKYWEPTGTTGANASGTWNTTAANWNTDSTGTVTTSTLTTFATGDDAVFSDDVSATGASAITTTALAAHSITFGNAGLGAGASGGATGSYTFSNGGNLTLGTTGTSSTIITLNAGVGAVTFNDAVISAVTGTFSIANNSSSLLTFAGVGHATAGSATIQLNGTGTGGVTFSAGIQNNFGNNGTGVATTLIFNTPNATTTFGGGTGNIYQGGLTLTAGTLAFTAANGLGQDAAGTANSGALSIGAAGQVNLSGLAQGMGALSGVAGGLVYNNSNTNATFTIGNDNNGGGTYAGILEDNNNGGTTTGTLALTKAGTGTITLSGANIYTGGTTVNGGTLIAGVSNVSTTSGAFGPSTSSVTLGNTTGAVAASILTGGAFTVSNPITVAAGSTGLLSIGGNTANSSIFSGTITLNNNLTVTQVGSGTTNLNGNITSGANGTQTLTFNNAGAVAQSAAGVIGGGTGTIAVTQASAGTSTLGGVNTYTGATNVTGVGGNLILNGSGSIANTSGITVGAVGQATSTLTYDNSAAGTATASRLGSGPVTLNGGTLAYKGIAAGTNTAGTASSGAITLGSNQTSFFNFTAASGAGNTSTFTIPSLTFNTNSTLSAFLASANSASGSIVVTTAPTLINGILPNTLETTNGNFLTLATGNRLGAYSNIAGADVTTFDNSATSNVKISAAVTAPTVATAENSLVNAYAGTQSLGGQALTLTSGGLILNAANAVLGSNSTDGSITTAAANPTLYVAANANGTINAPITDAAGPTSVALTKFGGSTLTLGGANTYTGATTVEQGGLTIAASGSIATTSAIALYAGTTFINNGTVGAVNNVVGATTTLNGGSTTGAITANGALTIAGTTAVTTGTISATGGTGTINYTNTFASGNTLNLSGTSLATITEAANAVLTANFTGTSSVTTFTDNNVTTPLAINNSGTLALGTLAGPSGSVTNLGGTGTTSIANVLNTPGQTVRFNSGTVNLNGSGNYNSTMIVNGATVNTQSSTSNSVNFQRVPNLQVLAGTLNVAETNGLRLGTDFGVGNGATNSSAGVQSGGNIVFTNNSGLNLGGNGTSAFTNTFALSGGTFNGSAAGSFLTVDAPTAGGGYSSFNFSGGTLLLNNTIKGTRTAAAESFVWTGGTLATAAYDATFLTSTQGTAVSATTNTLTNAGSGILAPGNIGTAGLTTITGNYAVTSGNAAYAVDLGTTTAGSGFQTGGYDRTNVTLTAALGGRLNASLVGGFLTTAPTSGTTFTILQTGTGTNSVGSLSGSFTNTEIGKTLPVIALSGTGATGLNSFSVTYNPGTATVNGSVVLGNYSAANTYTGATGSAWDATAAADWSVFDPGSTSAPATVASGAVAQFADNAGTGTVANAVTLNSTRNIQGISFASATAGHNYTINDAGNSTGVIILDNTANATVATINDTSASGNANAVNVPIALNSPLSVSVTNAANTLTLGGALSGAQMITKNGLGTVILSGTNTYTGATNVSTGTLLVNGSVGSSGTPAGALTVSSGATLGGANTGTTGTGMLTVASATVNGTLAPGATIGATTGALTLNTTGGLTLNGNLTIGTQAGGVGTSLATNGLLTLGGASTLTLTGTLDGTSNYDIANYGTLAGTFTSFTAPSGYTINYAGTSFGAADIELDVTAVPEPSTWVGALLLILGAFGIKFRRRKLQAN